MAKVLVTGCAGFIGSHLCERLLAEGHAVVGIDNFDPFYDKAVKEQNLSVFSGHEHFEFHELDFRYKVQLNDLEPVDVVIHLAAKAGVLPSLKHADEYIATNIVGTNNILEWMREGDMKKLLFASSSSIYGNNKKIPFNEEDVVNKPISPYAFTKRSCELMNFSYHHLYDFDILNLRLFTVYGPRQRPDLAIHKFVRLISEGDGITMYGDGSTARDYTYVKDTVSGFIQALDYIQSNSGVYEIINLGNNQPVKLKELIDTIYELTGNKPNIEQLPMQPGDVDITYADITKAQQFLGYQPKTGIRDGLQQFIEWYHEHS